MNICVIDDHLLFAQSLQNLLASAGAGYNVRIYHVADSFLRDDFSHWAPDIIISDVLMPGIKGLQLVDLIKKMGLKAKIILLSSLTDPLIVKEAMGKGVSAYINKNASKEELLDAIHHVLHNNEPYISSQLKEKIMAAYLYDSTSIHDPGLSPREKEILQKICAGFTPKEIAYDMQLSINTIQQYIKAITKKVGVNRTVDLVLYAIRKGLYAPPG